MRKKNGTGSKIPGFPSTRPIDPLSEHMFGSSRMEVEASRTGALFCSQIVFFLTKVCAGRWAALEWSVVGHTQTYGPVFSFFFCGALPQYPGKFTHPQLTWKDTHLRFWELAAGFIPTLQTLGETPDLCEILGGKGSKGMEEVLGIVVVVIWSVSGLIPSP